jgi:hypothetical protein
MLNDISSYKHNATSGKRSSKIIVAREKTNSKKFHLINWNIVIALKENGVFDIKVPYLMNLEKGEKIHWRTTRMVENYIVKEIFP